MMTIRVLVADDHRVMREALCALLATQPDLEIVGQADDGHAALRLARQLQPDVLITDLAMPGLNGIETTRRLRQDAPGTGVVCLSMHDDSRMVLAALDAGAGGYVLKEGSFAELAQAVRAVAVRQIHLSARLVGIVVQEVRQRQVPGSVAVCLTPREREVVQLLAEGFSTQQVAQRLHLSHKTVATHREHVMHKLEFSSLAQLTRYALREGLTTLDTPCASGTPALR